MAAITSKNEIDEVSQTIDLDSLTGAPVSDDKALVREIGQSIIDFMTSRVDTGKGIGGVKLKAPYSDSYADSLNFKAAGKSKKEINMQLSGDMLGSIDIVSESGAKIKIAVAEDQAPKAFNHQTGDTLPRRPFFGITAKEFKEYILPQFKSDLKEIKLNKAEKQSIALKTVMNSDEVVASGIFKRTVASDLFDEDL